MAKDIRDELKELGKEVSNLKTEADKVEGQLLAIRTQLKDEFNIDIEDVDKEIESLTKTYNNLKGKAEKYLEQAREIIDDGKRD